MPKKKDWLIRTRTHHILGPVSRDKVIELLDSGSMDPTDELCCGNGFWFSVKEGDLLEEYIRQGNQQPFNDISEAKSNNKNNSENSPDTIEELIPNKEMSEQSTTDESYTEKRTKKKRKAKTKQLVVNDQGEEKYIPSNDDLEYPDDEENES